MGRAVDLEFSDIGLTALFDYFTEYEDSTGEEMELDVIAICCEFSEYGDLDEIREVYRDLDGLDNDDALEWLNDRTTVIEFDGGIIISEF